MRKVLIFTMLFLALCSKFQKNIIISKATIQETLEQKFPVDKNAVVARLTLLDPVVYFKENFKEGFKTDKANIGLRLKYTGNFLEKEVSGNVDCNGFIIYKKGKFYLADFEIVEFSVDEKEFSSGGKLEKIIVKIVRNYIDSYPVYTLKQSDFKQNIARLLLKDITVSGENLNILIGI